MKVILFFLIFLAACAPIETSDWMSVPITDIDGNMFVIADIDTPVFLEAFATWCPTCVRQQKEFQRWNNSDVTLIALSIDPTDSEEILRAYTQEYGFDWTYAMSTPEFTQELVDNYGVNIVNAPLVPVLLICQDKTTHLLTNGVKDGDDLEEALLLCEL
jgi:thiol-disulfide isomerase/thioredoxin